METITVAPLGLNWSSLHNSRGSRLWLLTFGPLGLRSVNSDQVMVSTTRPLFARIFSRLRPNIARPRRTAGYAGRARDRRCRLRRGGTSFPAPALDNRQSLRFPCSAEPSTAHFVRRAILLPLAIPAW